MSGIGKFAAIDRKNFEEDRDMTEKVMDRRILRTRQSLHSALIALIRTKGYEAITVQDIIDEANVGRSTFYSHYTGKEDLFRKGFEHLRALLAAHQRDALATRGNSEGPRLAFSLAMFEHACENLDIYRALVGGRGVAIAVNSIRELICDLVRSELAATPEKIAGGGIQREILVQYAVGAFMGVLTWWLDRGARVSPAEIDNAFRRLALRGINAL